MNGESRAALRRRLRQARRALSPWQQRLASRQLYRQLAQHPLFRRSRHIAFYISNDGEIDPGLLMRQARARGKHCYLPVVSGWPRDRMRFQRIQRSQKWALNRFGISEPLPCSGLQTPPWRLDLILLPLVGFDAKGNRLGMGGGFYDRALAYRARRQSWQGPHLIGLAHGCQKVDALPVAAWDIPLDGIVSDAERLVPITGQRTQGAQANPASPDLGI
jgi:5-formyltetrahydrofolate cyclo-ligase